MIGNDSLGSIMGAPAVGPDDEKIGTVGQVFIDPHTGAPNWATVHTGLFGRHENFVPLDRATWDREILRLPYDKSLVKDAPRIDAGEALSSESEAELYRYYGIIPDVASVAPVEDTAAEADSAGGPAGSTTDRHPDHEAEVAGAEYSRQSRLQRYETSGVAAPGSASDADRATDASSLPDSDATPRTDTDTSGLDADGHRDGHRGGHTDAHIDAYTDAYTESSPAPAADAGAGAGAGAGADAGADADANGTVADANATVAGPGGTDANPDGAVANPSGTVADADDLPPARAEGAPPARDQGGPRHRA